MKPRSFAFTVLPLLPLLSLSVGAVACGGDRGSTGEASPQALARFASESELTAYLEKADRANPSKGESYGSASDASGASGASGSAPASNETITNNQEAGVDEGGIVKNIGSSLVVLRKGRLYAVSVAQAGQPALTDSVPVAPVDALNANVWYDEMLVRGDRIYVIGYRYGVKLTPDAAATPGAPGTEASYGHAGATEVSSFRMNAAGKLERLKTLFLESNDYFSGSNYASRMIEGTLVFYMPHGAWRYSSTGNGGTPAPALHIPTYFTSNGDGTFTKGAPIFTPTDVYVPLDLPQSPVFHTVVKCELPDDGAFACQSRALLSSYGREHYVTPGAVFLWSLPRAYMFRFADLGVVAHASAVQPRDQFSFKAKDGVLHIAGTEWRAPSTVDASEAEPIGSPSVPAAPPKIVVESLPLADFDAYGAQPLATKTRAVAVDASSSWVTKNRFVGDALFLGLARGYTYDAATGTSTTTSAPRVARFELGTGTTQVRDLGGEVTRIEPMGDTTALVAVQEESALALESLSTSGTLTPAGATRVPGLTEGESRSHGFFFKPSPDGNGGAFGLPVLNAQDTGGGGGGGGGWYGPGVSNIGFWSVSSAGALGALGMVSSSNETGLCETSCTDWYGNTRPIFLGARTFALMGSELAEIQVAPTAARLGTPAVLTFTK